MTASLAPTSILEGLGRLSYFLFLFIYQQGSNTYLDLTFKSRDLKRRHCLKEENTVALL